MNTDYATQSSLKNEITISETAVVKPAAEAIPLRLKSVFVTFRSAQAAPAKWICAAFASMYSMLLLDSWHATGMLLIICLAIQTGYSCI